MGGRNGITLSGNLKRVVTIVMFIQITGMNSYSQQLFHLTLKLVNKEDTTAVPYATVSLINQAGNTIVTAQSTIEGVCAFTLADSLNGKLKIVAKPLGYEPYSSPMIAFNGTAMLQTIMLEKNVTTLKEVTITERQVEKEGGNLTYRVKQDQFSAATATSDLLIKLPNVTLVSGTVKVDSRDGVLILIDGKGELKGQKEQLALLAAMSADQIEKIEVNTFPQARYDASITAIINVITKKQKSFSNVKASLNQPLYKDNKNFGAQYLNGGAATNLNFIVDNVKVSVVLAVHNNQYPENHVTQESVTGLENFTSTINSNYSGFYVAPNLNLDYDINDKSSLEFNADMNFVPSFTIHSFENDRFFNAANTVLDSVASINSHYTNNSKDIELTGSYKYLLNKKKKSNLYINLIYADNPLSLANQLVNNKTTDSTDSLSTIENHYTSSTTIINASVIFTDLLKTSFLSTEIGLKSNILTNNATQLLNADSSKFHYFEQISSLFLSAKWRFKKNLIVSEIRNEWLTSNTFFVQDSTIQTSNRDYFKIYPHLLLQQNVNDDFTISIGYIKNVRRPRLNFLNPSSIVTSYYNVITGNINNSPSYSDRIEAQAIYKDLGITAYYAIAANQIYFLPANGNPYEFQTANFGNVRTYGMSVNKAFNFGKWFSTNINADVSETYNPLSTLQYYKNHWASFDIDASTDITFSKTARLQTDLYYAAKTYMAYDAYGGQFYSTITYRQLFDKNFFSLNISITDPFGIQKNSSMDHYPQLTSVSHDTTNGRIVSVQLIYKFPFGQKFTNQVYEKQNNGEIRK